MQNDSHVHSLTARTAEAAPGSSNIEAAARPVSPRVHKTCPFIHEGAGRSNLEKRKFRI